MTNGTQQRQPAASSEGADLFDYALARHWLGFVLRAPRRHPWVAAACFLAIAGLGVVSLKLIPYRYQVQATLLAQRNPLMGSLSNPGLNREGDLPTRAAREVVRRRDNLIALCKQTDFVERYMQSRAPAVRAAHWVFARLRGHELDAEDRLDAVVDGLEQRLQVTANPAEGTVTIELEWSDPELTYQMVAAAMQSFIEARHASEINMVGETIAILQGHDARIRQEIAQTSKNLEEKARALRVRVAPSRPVLPRPAEGHGEELARLEGQLAARRRALADLEDFRQRRLSDLQAQLVQQLTVYAPQHPTVLSTRQSIESLNQPSPQLDALRAEVKDLSAQIERRGGRADSAARLDAVPTAVNQVNAELVEARLRLADEDPRLEFERTQLRLLLRQHTTLLDRIDAARVEMDTAEAAFKYRYIVVSPPQMPKGPIRPSPVSIVFGGLLGGVLFALFASTVLDLRGGRVVEPWQVERQAGVPVVGGIRQ